MYQISVLPNAVPLKSNFNDTKGIDTFVDMNNHYPNVLTPPMDSPDSIMLSPASGSNSPVQSYSIIQSYNCNSNAGQVQGSAPSLRIIEEPVERFRFRYKSEMAGTHGSLNGRTSDRTRKQTYPTVELHNFDRPAVIRCALYQYGREEMAYTRQPHAHRLVKKQGLDEIDDPHDLQVNPECGYVANFHSMGIIHTAKKYIVPELVRKNTLLKQEEIARSEHNFRELTKKEEVEIKALAEKESKSINLNIVCLRFDAFKVINNIFYPLCPPVYSNAINNLKSALTGDLKIVRMDHCTSSSRGGREIFILVEKVTKKNIKVRFYELDDEDNEVWSDFGRFSDLDVHHQYAIVFKTPAYKTVDIDRQVRVFIELQRPSDGARSEPKDFTYTPCEIILGKKRARYSLSSYSSSNFSSDEIPLTISNMAIDQEYHVGQNNADMNMDLGSPVVNSDDLDAALRQSNIDSAEFDKLCNSLIGSGSFKDLYATEELSSKDLKSLRLATDAPTLTAGCGGRPGYVSCQAESYHPERLQSTPIKKLNLKDQQMVDKVRMELTSFIKTNPTKPRVSVMLEHLFLNPNYLSENGDTVLHLLISENNKKNNFLAFLLKVLLTYQQTDFVNMCNKQGQTALHLAVISCNFSVVEHLVFTKADVSVQDLQGNTPLHIAVIKCVPVTILKLLLKTGTDVNKYIDLVNYDGHTALHLAVKTDNLPATKLLCWNHADVHAEDKKNGYTVLHMAVADQHLDIINFLLESTDIKCDQEDYSQCSALKLAKVLNRDETTVTKDIYYTLENFMKKIGIFEEVDIKEEIEDISDEEMEHIKTEPMSPDSVRYKYGKINSFPEECMSEICAILDKSGTWQNLAELLDYGHLLKTDLFKTPERPSKTLLGFAIASGDSLLQIRDFLENLDELRAVEIIDNMVKKECES